VAGKRWCGGHDRATGAGPAVHPGCGQAVREHGDNDAIMAATDCDTVIFGAIGTGKLAFAPPAPSVTGGGAARFDGCPVVRRSISVTEFSLEPAGDGIDGSTNRRGRCVRGATRTAA
jgi:hypothetical protein